MLRPGQPRQLLLRQLTAGHAAFLAQLEHGGGKGGLIALCQQHAVHRLAAFQQLKHCIAATDHAFRRLRWRLRGLL